LGVDVFFFFKKLFSLVLQMDLQRKFRAATASGMMPICSLIPNQEYDIVFAERVITRFGASVILTIEFNAATGTIKVFLPKRYGNVMTDIDILDIQQERVHLRLKYLGTCPISNAFQLAITPVTP
jgi:hypothetical protein